MIGYENKHYKIKYNDEEEVKMTHQEIKINLKYQTLTSRQRRKKRQVETIQRYKNTLVQTNLRGEQIPAKDSEFFGHSYPARIHTNCSIITYQNIGQQPRIGFNFKSRETSKAFKNSRASVAMYNETGLNEKQL